MLTAAAQRIEPPGKAKRRRWQLVVAALAVVAAAGGAATAILRRRAAQAPDPVMTGEDVTPEEAGPEDTPGDEPVMTDAEVAENGRQARR
jgi:hypothetical protein